MAADTPADSCGVHSAPNVLPRNQWPARPHSVLDSNPKPSAGERGAASSYSHPAILQSPHVEFLPGVSTIAGREHVPIVPAGKATRLGRPLPEQDCHLLDQRTFARRTWRTSPADRHAPTRRVADRNPRCAPWRPPATCARDAGFASRRLVYPRPIGRRTPHRDLSGLFRRSLRVLDRVELAVQNRWHGTHPPFPHDHVCLFATVSLATLASDFNAIPFRCHAVLNVPSRSRPSHAYDNEGESRTSATQSSRRAA